MRDNKYSFLGFGASLLLIGCTNIHLEPTTIDVESVVERTALEIDVLQGWINEEPTKPVGLCLSKLTFDLTTSIDLTSSESIGLVLATSVGIGANASLTRGQETSSNYVVAFSPSGPVRSGSLNPADKLPPDGTVPEELALKYPLAASLYELRRNLQNSSDVTQNLKNGPQLSVASMASKFTAKIYREEKREANFPVVIDPLTVTPSVSSSQKDSSTAVVTVEYSQVPKGKKYCQVTADSAISSPGVPPVGTGIYKPFDVPTGRTRTLVLDDL